MDWINKLPEWLKLSPRYLLPISLVSGFLLFANDSFLGKFGLGEFVVNFRSWIGIVFLMTTSLIVIDVLYQIFAWLKSIYINKRSQKIRFERFQNLTFEEKDILLSYLIQNTRTQYFPINDGVVLGLELEKMLFKSSNIGDPDSWPFNVQPWAWDMLKKHLNELFSNEEINHFKSLKTSASQRSRKRSGYGY
jgi:hypothetical protein